MGILALVLALQAAGQVYNQPTGGDRLVVMETDTFAANVPVGGKTWTVVNAGTATVAPAGFVGTNAMAILPDANSGSNTGATTFVNGSRLDFRVLFRATGVHYVWIRGRSVTGDSGNSDSCHVAINGIAAPEGFQMTGWADTEWRWARARSGGNASVNVPSLGVHTISLYMREDGFFADRILLTTNSAYTISPVTADGPTATGTIADQTPPQAAAPTLTPGDFSIRVTWSAVTNADTYILQRSDNGGAYATVFSGNSLTFNDVDLFDYNIDRCYRVAGVDTVFGPGLYSPATCSRSRLPPPRTQDNEEGLIDENCACGARAEGGPLAAWILLPLLLLFRRR